MPRPDHPPPEFRLPPCFVVFDLEYTTWEGAMERGWKGPGEHREIVQIGAIRYEGGQEHAAFNCLIRPVINTRLSAYFTKLTGIDQATVDADGLALGAGLELFAAFIDGLPAFCFGTDADIIAENCSLQRIDNPLDQHPTRDVRPAILAALGPLPGRITSSDLPRLIGLPAVGQAHEAVADSRAIGGALLHLFPAPEQPQ